MIVVILAKSAIESECIAHALMLDRRVWRRASKNNIVGLREISLIVGSGWAKYTGSDKQEIDEIVAALSATGRIKWKFEETALRFEV